MGRLDAAAAVAKVEDVLAFRDLSPAHFIGDAVGSKGLAVQMQNSIAMRIERVPPGEARATEKRRAVRWLCVNSRVAAAGDGAWRPSSGYSRPCQMEEVGPFGVVFVHGSCLRRADSSLGYRIQGDLQGSKRL